MKSRPLLVWVLTLALVLNTGANIFVLSVLSRIYSIDDFKPDLASREVQDRMAADNIELPPVKIVEFISAYAYRPSQIVFTGQNLIIFINLRIVSELSDVELRAVIAHELGHYIKGHLVFVPYPFTEEENQNFKEEVEADSVAAKYEGKEAIRGAIKRLTWDQNERSARLNALN